MQLCLHFTHKLAALRPLTPRTHSLVSAKQHDANSSSVPSLSTSSAPPSSSSSFEAPLDLHHHHHYRAHTITTTSTSTTTAIAATRRRKRGTTPSTGAEEDEDEDDDDVGGNEVDLGRAKGSGRRRGGGGSSRILENACKDDMELRAVLGDSIGNPELMRKRVEERVRKKGRDFSKSKSGSVLAFKVSFRDFNPLDSFIWFELYGAPSDRMLTFLAVIQSWYVMGRLGAFKSSNLQLANSSMDYNPSYDSDKASGQMPSSFHDISDVEFQDNWGRVWVDLGTSDFLAVDVLVNCLTVLSSE
uniref:Uncharacterized protein n=1 Tax=Ananas comosus var. bracteatus TaxID=296719 RepID=A0A6V7NR88_ANACO|nr:unnamed protein product [Ananas comosus var. bracteatus]